MTEPRESSRKLAEEEVKGFLDRFAGLYEKADEGFFDLFAPNATVFTVSSPALIDGRDNFKKGFAPHLKRDTKRVSQILSSEIQIFGETALVTYHNRIQLDSKSFDLRSSLVLNRNEKGSLSVTHLHNSPLGGRSLEDVVVLEERVATAIGAVGTPK
jgi:ketosteroid isomerase-like protein